MGQHVSLRQFIEALCGLPPGDPRDPDVIEVFESHRVDPDELERHVIWSDEQYTRTLMFRDDRFQIILLGWGVGQVTPVHDHAGQRCWMMIDRGRLQISDYCWKEGAGAPRLLHHEVVGGADGELHLDMCACVHRIENRREWGQRALSLHVYSRPFSRCGIYCVDTGEREITDLHFDSIAPRVEAL